MQFIKKLDQNKFLIIAVILALVSTFFIIRSARPSENKQIEMVKVIAAKQEIGLDTKITEEMLTSVEIPKSSYNASMYTDMSSIINKYVKTSILTGEYLRKERLRDQESDGYGSKEREYRVKVDNVTYGGVSPGSRADILWTGSLGSKEAIIGGIVLENVEVLKVLNEYEEDIYTLPRDKYNKQNIKAEIVVIKVDQDQAELLDLLKEYAGKDKPFTFSKYTERSREQGHEMKIFDIREKLNLPKVAAPADDQNTSEAKK